MFKKIKKFKENNLEDYALIKRITVIIFLTLLFACGFMKLFALALNEYETNKAQKSAEISNNACPSCGCVYENREE